MSRSLVRPVSAAALAAGLFALAAGGDLFAAGKEAEAKKYHEQLKSAKDAKARETTTSY